MGLLHMGLLLVPRPHCGDSMAGSLQAWQTGGEEGPQLARRVPSPPPTPDRTSAKLGTSGAM